MNLQFYNPPRDKTVWVTSDTHYGHTNICRGTSKWDDKSGCRNFESLDIMNQTLVDNINRLVQPQDILLFQGDWSFGGKHNIKLFRDQINCREIAYVCLGNHDHHIQNKREFQKLFSHVGWYNEFRWYKRLVCQSHFPMDSWHKIGRGSVHLFAHCHGTHKNPTGRRIDIGVDCHHMKPILLDNAIQLCLNKDVISYDHHQGQE